MPPKTPEQNKQVREKAKRKIQKAAFHLFACQGFSQTTMNAIAKKADTSKGLIYHYFDSKKDILENIFKDWVRATKCLTKLPEDWSPSKRMRKLITNFFQFIHQNPEIVRLMTALALQPDAIDAAKPYINKVYQEQVELATSLFRDLNYEHPQEEAYYLNAQFDGVIKGFLMQGNNYPLDTIKAKILDRYVPDEATR